MMEKFDVLRVNSEDLKVESDAIRAEFDVSHAHSLAQSAVSA